MIFDVSHSPHGKRFTRYEYTLEIKKGILRYDLSRFPEELGGWSNRPFSVFDMLRGSGYKFRKSSNMTDSISDFVKDLNVQSSYNRSKIKFLSLLNK